jgi:hypothetical protein
MRKNIEKEENEMHQIFQRRKEIEKYIKDIKELISKIQNQGENLISGISNSELVNALIISLFVLEVGVFEHWLKNLVYDLKKNLKKNKIKDNRDNFFEKTTLGIAIKLFEEEILEVSKKINLSPIWSFNFLFSFVCAAQEINNLRNDLYHNLYREGLIRKEIFNNIEKRLELNIFIKKYFIEEGRDSKVSRSLISNGKLPNNWTIEMLRESTSHLIQPLYLQQEKIKINKDKNKNQ